MLNFYSKFHISECHYSSCRLIRTFVLELTLGCVHLKRKQNLWYVLHISKLCSQHPHSTVYDNISQKAGKPCHTKF